MFDVRDQSGPCGCYPRRCRVSALDVGLSSDTERAKKAEVVTCVLGGYA